MTPAFWEGLLQQYFDFSLLKSVLLILSLTHDSIFVCLPCAMPFLILSLTEFLILSYNLSDFYSFFFLVLLH